MTTRHSLGHDATGLPVIPLPRDARCPLHPPPEFTAWRDSDGMQPVSWRGQPAWAVSRYADIRQALTDPRVSANVNTFDNQGTVDPTLALVFPRMDDPEHNRLRRMLTSDFTVRRIAAMRPQIQALVDGFLDTMVEKGPPTDLVRDFALPIPSMVISELLGVPYADHEFFETNSAKNLDTTDPTAAAMAGGAIYNYVNEMVSAKMRDPGDDLMSRQAARAAQGDINAETAATTGLIMLSAGHETTASMIALGTLTLLQHPEVFELLATAEEDAVVLNVVDELMRYLSIVHSLVDRIVIEDFELGGQQVRKGDLLLINIPAGNWDPTFAQNPEVFDIKRNVRGHLGFGYGVHQCIGLNLARLELQIALPSLARQMPHLRLAVPADKLEFNATHAIYSLVELPVTWGQGAT
jgi:cytochrome P450